MLVRARLFRRDMVLSRNAHSPSGLAFTNLKKFLGVPRGVFSKTLPWQGVGRRPTKEERASPTGCAFSGGTKSLHETPQIVQLRLYAPKKFLRVPRSVFSKTLLGREWDRVPQREGEPAIGARLFRRDEVLLRNAHSPSGFAFTNLKKFLRVPRGVFSKTLPWQGVGQRPTKRERTYMAGYAFSGGTKSFHETPTARPAWPSRTQKSF